MKHHFVIVSDNFRQRMALSQTLQKLGLAVAACVDSEQLKLGDAMPQRAIWLVDVDDFYAVEYDIFANKPQLVLVGFSAAPDYSGSKLYQKWQRALSRKLSEILDQPTSLATPKKAHNPKPWQYVVLLGASMGGPNAIKRFLDGLSPNLPIAVLIAHHFDEQMIYTLPKVLTRQNQWRCQVVSTTQSLQSGLCLIAPIDRQVVCDSTGRVILTKHSWVGDYKPNIGAMLKNASEVYGAQLIGIIFSGMGTDGSQFGKEIAKNRSQFWAQDPQSADSPSQPQAFIDTGVCQFVGTPEMMSAKLNHMMSSHLLNYATTESTTL